MGNLTNLVSAPFPKKTMLQLGNEALKEENDRIPTIFAELAEPSLPRRQDSCTPLTSTFGLPSHQNSPPLTIPSPHEHTLQIVHQPAIAAMPQSFSLLSKLSTPARSPSNLVSSGSLSILGPCFGWDWLVLVPVAE